MPCGNLEIIIRNDLITPTHPSIPSCGVVAISYLFYSRQWGVYRLLEQGQNFSTSINKRKEKSPEIAAYIKGKEGAIESRKKLRRKKMLG